MVVPIHQFNQLFIMVYIHQMLQIMVLLIFIPFLFKLSSFFLGNQFDNPSIGSICLTRDVLNSHLYGSHHSTDGKHYLFAIELAMGDINNDSIVLSNKDANLALPTYLIVYQRRN